MLERGAIAFSTVGSSYSKWVWAKEPGPSLSHGSGCSDHRSSLPDPGVPSEARDWGGRGSWVVSVGAPSTLSSAGIHSSELSSLQSLTHPHPGPGLCPLKTPLADNEWGLEATSAAQLYPYSEYPLCIYKPSNLTGSSEFWLSTCWKPV